MSFNGKAFLGLRISFSEDREFLSKPESSLDSETKQVFSSKRLMSIVEKEGSLTQEFCCMPALLTSSSSQNFYSEFRKRKASLDKVFDLSVMIVLLTFLRKFVFFVDYFSCEEVPSSFEDVKKSKSRED